MLKNEKSANRNEHQNRKTEGFWHKNRKTDLKNSQNRKTENPNAPLLSCITVYYELRKCESLEGLYLLKLLIMTIQQNAI